MLENENSRMKTKPVVKCFVLQRWIEFILAAIQVTCPKFDFMLQHFSFKILLGAKGYLDIFGSNNLSMISMISKIIFEISNFAPLKSV